MNKSYWDGLANCFEDEVFSVYKQDRNKLITNTIRRYGASNLSAADLGCGVGAFLPSIAACFRHVYAVDISPKCLKQAKQRCSEFDNIEFINVNLSATRIKLPRYDFGVSVNALLSPSLDNRLRFINASIQHLKKGGYFVLVVPALESALLRNQRLIDWNLKEGLAPQYAQRSALTGSEGFNSKKACIGTIELDGVETKHYLKEELQLMLEKRSMALITMKKIQYTWDTEFNDPPAWMGAPYPWDWFVLAKKQ